MHASLLIYTSCGKVLTRGQSAEQKVEYCQVTRSLDSLDSVNSLGEMIRTLTYASSHHAFMC